MSEQSTWYRVFFIFAAETVPPPQVTNIRKWVSSILPHTMGIREWAHFHERFGRKPSAGESAHFGLSCFVLCSVFSFTLYLRLVEFLSLVSRRRARRVRPPMFAFCQPASSARPLPIVAVDKGIQSLAILRTTSASELVRSEAALRSDTLVPTVHSANEPSHDGGEEAPPKRRRIMSEGVSLIETSSRGDPVSVVSEAGGDASLGVEAMPVTVIKKAAMAGGRVRRLPRLFRVVHRHLGRSAPHLRLMKG